MRWVGNENWMELSRCLKCVIRPGISFEIMTRSRTLTILNNAWFPCFLVFFFMCPHEKNTGLTLPPWKIGSRTANLQFHSINFIVATWWLKIVLIKCTSCHLQLKVLMHFYGNFIWTTKVKLCKSIKWNKQRSEKCNLSFSFLPRSILHED